MRLVTIRFQPLGNLVGFLATLLRAYAYAMQGATRSGVRQSEGTKPFTLQLGNEFLGLLLRTETTNLYYPTGEADHRLDGGGLDGRLCRRGGD
jgi:hypothetical protein